MARCIYCGNETSPSFGDHQTCHECEPAFSERGAATAKLVHDLHEATKRAQAAGDAFLAICSDIPSGIPHPDGTQRIRNARREMTHARDEMTKAHNRLSDLLNTER
jgi:hypothetical protein